MADIVGIHVTIRNVAKIFLNSTVKIKFCKMLVKLGKIFYLLATFYPVNICAIIRTFINQSLNLVLIIKNQLIINITQIITKYRGCSYIFNKLH